MLVCGAALCLAACGGGSADHIGYRDASGAEQRKSLLLKDFQPQSMLHAGETRVERAKFPAIDIHNHINDAQGVGYRESPRKIVATMDATNVRTIVILTGQWGEKLQGVIDQMVTPYPGRFMVFTQVDWSLIGDPAFATKTVAQIEDAVRRGARGLKVLKDLGLEVRDKSGTLVTVDDPRLDPIWAACGRLRIPVAIHTSDPEAFFRPIDAHNERYEELVDHPDWSFARPGLPKKEELLAARDRVFARHPETAFIALHVANWPENLDYVSGLLDRQPNVVVEIGAREAELGRQPRRAREFFLKYQDRILFGTDLTPEPEMYRNYFRWLETGDESFDYWGAPRNGRWKIYGLQLPDEVLEKIYRLNADRVLRR